MKTALTCYGIGFVAGLRSMTAPAALALTATATSGRRGKKRYLLAALALGELVADKLPMTPSRKEAAPFAGRIASGAISGAVLGARQGALFMGLLAGTAGAITGTLVGAELRGKLADLLGSDLPAALVEDVIAIVGAAALVRRPSPATP